MTNTSKKALGSLDKKPSFHLEISRFFPDHLDNYSKNLNEIKSAIKNKDSKKLLDIFSSTKKVRKEIIEAGQDTAKPDFGRK